MPPVGAPPRVSAHRYRGEPPAHRPTARPDGPDARPTNAKSIGMIWHVLILLDLGRHCAGFVSPPPSIRPSKTPAAHLDDDDAQAPAPGGDSRPEAPDAGPPARPLSHSPRTPARKTP